MGYILLPPKYISEKCENYHLFEAVYDYDEYDEKEIISIKYNEDDEDYEKSECGELESSEYQYNWKDFEEKILTWNNEEYEYYKKGNIYYFPNDFVARIIIASNIKKKACGRCVATLYSDKK